MPAQGRKIALMGLRSATEISASISRVEPELERCTISIQPTGRLLYQFVGVSEDAIWRRVL